MGNPNNWTGERLEINISNETMLEHLHRYAIAQELVKGKKVLDIACGEGYGVNLLAKQAGHVTGVDNDGATIEKAKNKYKAGNITFKTGSALQMPAENNCFDIITCFETLEHLSEHDLLLNELKRVLVKGGILLISTPEKLNYSDIPGYKNPYHQKELYGQEFKDLLNRFFTHTCFFSQTSFIGSVLQNETLDGPHKFYTGDYNDIQKGFAVPVMYWIAIASDRELPSFSDSSFQHQKKLSQMLFEETEALKKTITYRTGNVLLSPLKFIRSLFKR